jgi:hypothetical protein
MNRVARALGVVVLAAAAASCGGDEDPSSTYFTATPYGNAACNVVDARLEGSREMRLFSSGTVDLQGMTQGLARYYRRHSLTFTTRSSPQQAGTRYALDTDQNALGAALVAAFPDVDFEDEAAVMADPVKWNAIMTFIANFMLRPMIDFARAHGDVGQAATNLAVIPDLERPGGMKLGGPDATIVGIAISPPLLAEFMRTMVDEGEIWKGVDLPPNFTPMMFLGHNAIRMTTAATPVLRDLTAAHEFGHASGLLHDETLHNLMYPGVAPNVNGCTDGLTDAQLAVMRANLGVGPAATSAALSSAGPTRARFMPADLRALLGGDQRALRRFFEPLLEPLLGPLVHQEPPGAPVP